MKISALFHVLMNRLTKIQFQIFLFLYYLIMIMDSIFEVAVWFSEVLPVIM